MVDWFEKVNGGEELYTYIEGPKTGQKILCCKSKIIWKSPELCIDDNKELKGDIIKLLEAQGNRVLKEKVVMQSKLVICGAGYVGTAVAEFGKKIGFEVIIIDEREEFVKAARDAVGVRGITDDFGSGLDAVDSDENTYFVIVTRGHSKDLICLDSILKKPAGYIGMMGSKKRCQRAVNEMNARGYDTKKIHAPIGLNINAESPEEIAISIMGEIISIKNNYIKEQSWHEIIDKLKKNKSKGIECVLATIVSKTGSAPRSMGTKMLIGADGQNVGTIGGGYIEGEVLKAAEGIFLGTENACILRQYGTFSKDEDVGCGGSVEVFMEKLLEIS